MGVDPGLIDLAEHTPSQRIHLLSRAEIAQLGVETGERYETGWTPLEGTWAPETIWEPYLIKVLTQPGGPDRSERGLSFVRLSCRTSASGPWFILMYPREMSLGDYSRPDSIWIESDDGPIRLSADRVIRNNGQFDIWNFHGDFLDIFRRATAARDLTIVEKYQTGADQLVSRVVAFSTRGLKAALNVLQERCNQKPSDTAKSASETNQ
jgi:hypothetical protein